MGQTWVRVSGIVTTVAFGVLVVAGIGFLPTGGATSLIAATAIAIGFAGAGYGMLRLTRSSGIAVRATASARPDQEQAQRRGRRAVRVQSIVFLILGIAIFAIRLLLGGEDDGDPRLVVGGVVLIVLGVSGLIVSARAERPRAQDLDVDVERRREPDSPVHVGGWQRVTRRDLASVLAIAAPGAGLAIFFAWQSVSLFFFTIRGLDGAGLLIAAVLTFVAAVGVSVAVVSRIAPEVWIDVDGQRVRSGSRIVAWDEIIAARLSGTAAFIGGTRTLILTLEGPKKTRFPLILRRRGRLMLTGREREAVLALIEGAAIALPRAPEDPKGKFSRMLFPSHLDVTQARDLVARPPRSDEDLPVPLA